MLKSFYSLAFFLTFLTTQLHAQEKTASKQITLETDAAAGTTIHIDNVNRKITIKPSVNNKVRLVTTVFYEGTNSLTDADWFNNLNLELRSSGSDMVIQSGRLSGNAAKVAKKTAAVSDGYEVRNASGTGIAQLDSTGQWTNRKANINRDLELYIPAGIKLDITSKYADVIIEANPDELYAAINHANILLNDCRKAVIRGNFTNVRAGKIADATIEINNGELQAKEINKGNITSKNSSVGIMVSNDLIVRSTDDQYDLDEIKKLNGTKDFGDLRILRVTGSIDLTGNTADLKVRNILPSASLIKIDNKYASIELPVAGLVNYTVSLEGKLTTVHAPFTKQEKAASSSSTIDAPPADAGFKTTIGDNKGAHTQFQLTCNTCTVNFR